MDEASLAAVTSWFTPTILFCVLNLMVATIYATSTFKNNQKKPNRVNENDPVQLFRTPSLLERVKSTNFSRFRAAEAETRYVQRDEEDMDDHVVVERKSGPSLLERVKSINLSRYRAEQPKTRYVQRDEDMENHVNDVKRKSGPSLLERVKSINFSRHRAEQPETRCVQRDEDHVVNQGMDDHVVKTKSLPRMEAPARRKAKMKKSASAKIPTGVLDDDELVEFRRPETARQRRGKWDASGGDDDDEDEDEAVDEKADDFITRFRQQLKLQRIDSILRNNGVGR